MKITKMTRNKVLSAIVAVNSPVTRLLSVGVDEKTVKGEEMGVLTGILYMQPSIFTCPASKAASCLVGCLNSAGRGAFSNVQSARESKTKLFFNNPELFFALLILDIIALKSKAAKEGLIPAVRLNGTSDIAYEEISFFYEDTFYANIFELFSDIQFYDYSKRAKRVYSKLPNNYHLTLSYSEARPSYAKGIVKAAHDTGTNIAVVFNGALPKTFKGLPVIDGDDSDVRFFDDKGVIVGLKAKGKAKRDVSGFVVHTDNLIASF
jgi:hypothetical protein